MSLNPVYTIKYRERPDSEVYTINKTKGLKTLGSMRLAVIRKKEESLEEIDDIMFRPGGQSAVKIDWHKKTVTEISWTPEKDYTGSSHGPWYQKFGDISKV